MIALEPVEPVTSDTPADAPLPGSPATASPAIGSPAVEAAGADLVDKTESRIRQMFSEISGRYDLMNHVLSGGVDYYWRWVTVRACPPVGNAPMLDVCTGTGDLALAYWQAAKRQVPVVATDFTPEMLAIAATKESRLRQRGSNRLGETAPIDWIEADTQHLPFESNLFQLVSVAFGLRNVTNTERGLAEMTRVCQPGGKVVVLEFSLPSNSLLRSAYLWYFRNILPRLGQLFARNRQSAYNYLPDSVAQFPYGQDLADKLQQAGLKDVWFRPLTFGIATLYCGTKPAADTGTPPATEDSTLSQVPPVSQPCQ